MLVKDKIIVVTGGGNGIGRALVLNLLGKGAKVAAVDQRESALQETENLAGDKKGNLSLHLLDITDKDAVDKFPEQVIAKHGAVDGIINNAGIIQPFIRINNLDFATIEKVMNVNFYGTLYMVKSFLPYLLKRSEAHILNISSMGGFLPVPGQSIYGASKAAVKLLTEGLYAELIDTRVKVSIVYPGAVKTNISSNSGVENPVSSQKESKQPEMKMLSADEAAEQIIAGMEKNKIRMCIGKDSSFLDKMYRLNPVFATQFISKQMKSFLKD